MKPPARILFFVFITLVTLFGCENIQPSLDKTDLVPTDFETVNNLAHVTMSFSPRSISPTGGKITIKNDTQTDLVFGEPYLLEKKINNNWYEVPTIIEEYGFDDIGYELNKLTTSEW